MNIRKALQDQMMGNKRSKTDWKKIAIMQQLDKMFYVMKEDENMEEVRTGLHASAIISGDKSFCYRKQVLSLLYHQTQGAELPLKQLKRYAAGNSIHEKWQTMFEKCSGKNGFKLIQNEARSILEKYDITFTPDSIIEINFKPYIVEIKSMNAASYVKAEESRVPHLSAKKQAMMYMFLTGIHNAIIIMENKDTQETMIDLIEFDYNEVIPFIARLNSIQEMKQDFIENGREPKIMCSSSDCGAARNCNMREACYNIGRGRIEL